MVRKSLPLVLCLVFASPLAAQEELVWSSKRPDAQAPFGVLGGRTLERGEVEVTYRFGQLNLAGIRFLDAPMSFEDVADIYDAVPLSRRDRNQGIGLAFGATPDLTFTADMTYSQRRREQLTADETAVFINDVGKLGDLEVAALYRVWDTGPYRAHLQAGARIPTGAHDVEAQTWFSRPRPEPLPYDMRPGAGVFGFLPGITALAQNDAGTVGAQVKGTVFFGTNDRDFSPGDVLEMNAWASVRVNEYFSFSARAAYQSWTALEGADERLDPYRDPGNAALFSGGSRFDLPIGLNVYLPQGTRFAGHRLFLEYIYPVSQKYDSPQLAVDWGLVAGWQVTF